MSFDDSFPKRVAIARNSAGMTQAELAKKVGVVPRQIAAYEGGEARPRDKALNNLAAALGATIEWLTKGTGKGPDVSNIKKTVTTSLIPVYSKLQAVKLKQNIDFQSSSVSMFIPKPDIAGEKSFAITVDGDSMTNSSNGVSFPEGSIVTIDPDIEPVSGDFVLVALGDNNEASFKQFVVDQGKTYLKALNSLWPVIQLPIGSKIIGKAVHSQMLLAEPNRSANNKRVVIDGLDSKRLPYVVELISALTQNHTSTEILDREIESILSGRPNPGKSFSEDNKPDDAYCYKSRIEAISSLSISIQNKINDVIQERFELLRERIKFYESISDEEYSQKHQEWLVERRNNNPEYGSW